MRPMLASQGTTVPRGPAWAHEVKWDGMRVLADVREGRLTLTSRNENDVTASFPELAGLGALFADMLLDGEVVALDGGVPSFGALAERMHVHDARRAARARRPPGRSPTWSSTCCACTASTSPAARWPSGAPPWSGWTCRARSGGCHRRTTTGSCCRRRPSSRGSRAW